MTDKPWLEPKDAAVIEGLEPFEVCFAKNQSEYRPLRALKSMKNDGAILTRWDLTPEQRAAIANGADLFLEVLTFCQPLQPVRLSVTAEPYDGYFKEYFMEVYGLPELKP